MIDGLPRTTVSPLHVPPRAIPQDYPEKTADRIVCIFHSLETCMEARGYFFVQSNDEQYFLRDLSYGQNYETILPTMPEDIQFLHGTLCELVAVKLKHNPHSLSHTILLRRVFKEDGSLNSEIIKKVVTEVLVREQRCPTSPIYHPR